MPEIGFYPSAKRARASIDIIIRYRGMRYKVPSGVSVLTKFWNKKSQRVKETMMYRDCAFINSRLDALEIDCREVMQSVILSKAVPTQKELSLILGAKIKPNGHIDSALVLDYVDHFISQVHRAPLTIKRYSTTRNKIKAYQDEFSLKLRFEDMNMNFYNSFQHWMYLKGFSVNYFGDIIKNLKVFFRAARSEGIHACRLPDKFTVVSEDSDSVYLSTDELAKLHDLVIDEDLILDNHSLGILNVKGNIERMIASLEDCRDRFLIGAYTALRFSDYAFLSGIRSADEYISRTSQKTGTRTVIPMHPVIRTILQRRGDILPPAISNQKMNDQLKLLCRLAKIEDKIETVITRGGRKVRDLRPKYELVCTHTARRSGCTNMFLAGIDLVSIMQFSGHKSLKSFLKYIRSGPMETALKLKDHPFFSR